MPILLIIPWSMYAYQQVFYLVFNKQYLHVIDDVLMPLTSNQPNAYRIPNLNALQFINASNTLDIGTHRVRSFRERVFVAGRGNLFEAAGYHTFLVPVEEGFKVCFLFTFIFISKTRIFYVYICVGLPSQYNNVN